MTDITDIITSATEPWADIVKFMALCDERGITVTTGKRHNRTDGEVHYILGHGDDMLGFTANGWERRSPGWRDAVKWVLSRR